MQHGTGDLGTIAAPSTATGIDRTDDGRDAIGMGDKITHCPGHGMKLPRKEMTMPKPIEKRVYECEWCSESFWDELECAKHEMDCKERPQRATYQERICVFCKHFVLNMGWAGYSEYTPGSNAVVKCDKEIWTLNTDGSAEQYYRRCIKSAETCSLFEIVRGYEHLFPED
jgi:hypothetical protein